MEAELGPKQYEEKEVPHWINRINELLIEKLVQQQTGGEFENDQCECGHDWGAPVC